MKLKQSLSHPELFIGEDGSVFKDGQRLSINKSHCTTMRGPAIAYRHNGKVKQLSVLRLVYEVYVKKAKFEPGDFIEFYDGDEMNTDASNLYTGKKYSKPVKRTIKKKDQGESHECWMGINEVYC
jgi:hypothetical protein